ncbi:MAG: hypothetical protein ISS88_02840 [Candidatus Portnoybacteria bacterium]|nr:hypothetical protein [Candidatus Portnoybacteria bacterium]
MFNLILYFLIGFSLIGLGIIVYRKIPLLARLSEEEMIILGRKRGIIQRLREINYKQHWLNLIVYLEKFLRRIKIIFLKIENLLSKWINGLRRMSQVMTQKSKEWIKQRELKRRTLRQAQNAKEKISTGTSEEIPVKINKKEEEEEVSQLSEDDEDIPISELKKPIKEEQKWIDLIVENPKNITAYKFLGLLYWRQHNYSDAKASLEMAVKLGSKDKKVKEVLAELKKMGAK